jgi:hypothetical protein
MSYEKGSLLNNTCAPAQGGVEVYVVALLTPSCSGRRGVYDKKTEEESHRGEFVSSGAGLSKYDYQICREDRR